MALQFKTIRWCNFLSTGSQFTEVKLDSSPTTLIVGENGSGKSTILDALCYALFNKAFRDVNKPQLCNSINGKGMVVEVEFCIGSKEYKIVRGVKPNLFEIYLNGVLINQDAAARDYQKYLEDHVLKLNYKSFTQIVILGSASFTPFMQLPTAHRREVIEDLLDIKIFSIMNDALKEKQAGLRVKLTELDNKIELGKSKVKLQQSYIATLEQDKQKKSKEIEETISHSNSQIELFTANVENVTFLVETLRATITDNAECELKEKQLLALAGKLESKLEKIKKEVSFYHDNDTCPTCSQTLNEDFKSETIQCHNETLAEVEHAIDDIKSQIQGIQHRLLEIRNVKDSIADNNDVIITNNNFIIAEQNYIRKLEKEIQGTATSTANIDEEKAKLKVIAKEVVTASEEKSVLVEERHYLDIAGLLLKDTGIKTTIIKQYLPVINKLVNKFLQVLEMFVHFELDETFAEVIKSRHRDTFSYASFSEGEKARIDISILLAFRTIAKMKNTANTNLLIMDEIFDSSLDINGTDFVMNLLNTLGDDSNVVVISHRDALFDKFSNVIKFEKIQNFSRIAK
tara:strand:- start:308 stop:2023 length:1716 start_codon:yes stop_codon:yes gene_type:complete